MNGNDLPEEGQTLDAAICGAAATNKGFVTCIDSEKIKVKNCGNFFIYFISPFKHPMIVQNTGSAMCIQSESFSKNTDLSIQGESRTNDLLGVYKVSQEQMIY